MKSNTPLAQLALSLTLAMTSTFAFAGGSSTVGPANPASVKCIELGGSFDASGSGICLIGQWQLFGEMNKSGLTKSYSSNGGANPAAVNCVAIGGDLLSSTTSEDTICAVEQWKLWSVFNTKNAQN